MNMSVLSELSPINGISAARGVQTSESSTDYYALDAHLSNSNPQDFATTYQKARQLLLQSGKRTTPYLICRRITDEPRCES
jgi:hypothetical protein